MSTIAVIAKEPIAGRVKTRLCPPCTTEQAADLADAALRDTLAAVSRTRAQRRVLIFEGDAEKYRRGFDVIPQSGGDLARRLGRGFDAIGSAAFLIGMDTPQVTTSALDEALDALSAPDVDAVLGPTFDGGYWGIGLKEPDPAVFTGVPMSSTETFRSQLERLRHLDLRVSFLPPLRDVDLFHDAVTVAGSIPDSGFARHVWEVQQELAIA